MNGGTPPLAPDNNRVRPCKVILPKLSVDTAVKSEELSVKDTDIYLEDGEKKPCDTKMASNNTLNENATAATNISSLNKPSFIAVSTPQQPTYISSGQGMFGSTTITRVIPGSNMREDIKFLEDDGSDRDEAEASDDDIEDDDEEAEGEAEGCHM